MVLALNLLHILILFLSFAYGYWRWTRKHFFKLAETIPGIENQSSIRNIFNFKGSPSDMFKKICYYAANFDSVSKLWLGPKLVVFLFDPRDVEIILSSHVHLKKSEEYDFFRPWLGKSGLLISSGEKWKMHRKLIAPTFHLNVLKRFIDLFNNNSQEIVQRLRKEVGRSFDCHDYLSEATVEILLGTVMGVNKKTQNSVYDYAMAVMKMCNILHLRQLKLWLRPNFLFRFSSLAKKQKQVLNLMHTFTANIVKQRVNTKINAAVIPDPTSSEDIDFQDESFGQAFGLKDDLDVNVGLKKRVAFLDLLIEKSQNEDLITYDEMVQQVSTILFEGHDTTAAGSSFFLSLMGCYPEIQEKVIQEMDKIFKDSDRPATFSDTLEMKYLEKCLLETLRLYPPVPLIGRQIEEDVQLASGNYTLPGGCTVLINIFQMHRKGNIYPHPDKFDPENFAPERTTNRHYYSFIPFSAGPRSCVGRKYAILKLKILLSTIMRNFRVVSDIKEDAFQLQGDIILKRSEGFKIKLEPRNVKRRH